MLRIITTSTNNNTAIAPKVIANSIKVALLAKFLPANPAAVDTNKLCTLTLDTTARTMVTTHKVDLSLWASRTAATDTDKL